MTQKVYITWQQVREAIENLNLDATKRYYGVPRGGSVIAAMLNPVETPEEADFIIDDLIDSGSTLKRYKESHPDKPFIALFKATQDTWLVFPWEVNETPAEENFKRILQSLGEDVEREGLRDTPKRYMKFMREFLSPPEFNFTAFDSEGMDEMIVQTHIPFYSLCEHHTAPFYGHAHVAYIPDKKIVGLSKLARTVEWYSRRFQNQERITSQVAEMIQSELNPKGVAVVLKAQHLCMTMRGVKKHDTHTVTSKMLGVFQDDQAARNELFKLIDLNSK